MTARIRFRFAGDRSRRDHALGISGLTYRTLSLRYTDFIAPMVKAMQEQQGMIERLQVEVVEVRRMLGK